ncbi:MAG: tetratricopeptide repeat protein, partial [Merismopedia sp. SIO2A8]|nr:tetratricopeptide repeat protein [Merismopedia sp. SIO2A8]
YSLPLVDTSSSQPVDDYSLLDGYDQIEQQLGDYDDLPVPSERPSPIPAYTPTTNGHSQRAGFHDLSKLIQTSSDSDFEPAEDNALMNDKAVNDETANDETTNTEHSLQSDAPLGLTGFDVLDSLDAITDGLLKNSSDSEMQSPQPNESTIDPDAPLDDLDLDNDLEALLNDNPLLDNELDSDDESLSNMEALIRGLEEDISDANSIVDDLEDGVLQSFQQSELLEDALVEDALVEDALVEDALVEDALIEETLAEDVLVEDALAEDALAEDEVIESLDAPLDVVDANPGVLIPDLVSTTGDGSSSSLPFAIFPGEQEASLFDSDNPAVQPLLERIIVLQRQQADLSVIAVAYRHLGNFYRDRIEQGDLSPQNLIQSMQAYKHVLQRIEETNPMWSEVLNDMGNLCWLLSRSAPNPEQGLPHLQQGITSYRMALTQINPKTHPQTYPMVQNNLGAAYGDLARYQEPVENLQQSIHAYQEALLYRSIEHEPLRYASTQNNLGTTYWNLAQHLNPVGNLKNAIASYSEALRLYRPNSDPLNYAMIQNNLGTTYWNLAQHEQSGDWLRLAIMAYETALKYRTLETNPAAFAATQNNLGTAYWHVATYVEEDPAQKLTALTKAIRSYDSALTAVTVIGQMSQPIPLNFDVLATHNNLGLVQYQISTEQDIQALEQPEPIDYLDAAIEHHLVALQGWQGRPELRQTALNCVLQTLQAIYNQKGLRSQNIALSKIPSYLLPEIMPQL